jgi:hypothetical protein
MASPTTPASYASSAAYSKPFFPSVSYNQKTFPRKRFSEASRATLGSMNEIKDVLLSTSFTS